MGVGKDKIPEQINLRSLYEKRFVLPKHFRKWVQKTIDSGTRGPFTIKGEGHPNREFECYIDQKGQAFVLIPNPNYNPKLPQDDPNSDKNIMLGSGTFGKVYLAQNAITGKWCCMKRALAGGEFSIAELNILKREGMYVSGKSFTERANEELQEKIQKKLKEDIPKELRKKLSHLLTKLQKFQDDGVDISLEPAEKNILYQAGVVASNKILPDERTLVEELIHGKSLSSIIEDNEEQRTLSFEQALALTFSLAEAYENLHSQGYVHRDIKPENVIVDLEQNKCIAIDFGFVVKVGEEHPYPHSGSPAYMSLDKLHSKVPNLADDAYAFGITMSQLFSSMAPEEDFEVFVNIFKIERSKLKSQGKELPKELEELLVKLYQRKTQVDELEKIWKTMPGGALAGSARVTHKSISHVLLAAESGAYRKGHKISKEQGALFKLLYRMTEPKSSLTDPALASRPLISNAITEMREIRQAHIKARMDKTEESPYKALMEDLWKASLDVPNGSRARDDVDSFLLRMVDKNKKNRPRIAEVNKYKDKLILTLEKHNEIHRSIKENEPKLLSTKAGIENISAEITTEIKKIIKPLLDMNTIYQDRYYAELRKKGKSQNVMLFSYPDKKFKIAELFERELQHLLNDDKIEVTAVQNLLQKFKSLNESSTKFGDAETTAFSEMLNEMIKGTETPLSNLEQQYKDKVLAMPSKTPSPKKFKF